MLSIYIRLNVIFKRKSKFFLVICKNCTVILSCYNSAKWKSLRNGPKIAPKSKDDNLYHTTP